ncbi:hypothetical protein TOPH_03463 [Tolypocladium ophioglossoides CBS 100239]|uniref:PRISE-like Rossmann-fold domain-containing protein n=1 Tax=Tolypocladium ophioglossoides (strain CBS 100239) TaxID=1163406 RepID=A0A0L0NDG7_TOLOC|nr:hypothetical protein TOPH_03463 [Tolypocladium ophioglossoides CBS 100239]
MAIDPNHAIVFGAAGLLGWSVVNQLLSNYPSADSFSQVTAVINRPVSEPDLHLPKPSPERPGFQVVSGVNLLQGTGDDLAGQLKDKVPSAEKITHVFYFVFSALNDDHIQECRINCEMMQRVADALNIVSPALKSFVYSGGTRGYGIYVPGGTFKAPLEESLADQLPEDYAGCAYPLFRRILTKASHGRDWTWTEVCPDAVIGFSPNGSGFSLALHWAQYLSLYAYNHGIRAGSGQRVEVPFPGCEEALDSKFAPVSSKILGRISIHAAMNPDTCGGKVVNMADDEQPTTFRHIWPAAASWFGLVGVGPSNDAGALKPGAYVAKYKHVFGENGRHKAVACGVGAGAAQLDSVGWWLTFDRQLSLKRLRALGFEERRNPVEGWLEAFEQFRDAGIIL